MTIFASTPPLNADPNPNVWIHHSPRDQMRTDTEMFRLGARENATLGYVRCPRPQFDQPRAHGANLILIASRKAVTEGAKVSEILDDLNGYQVSYPGSDEIQAAVDELHNQSFSGPWRNMFDHARRVLERLAVFA